MDLTQLIRTRDDGTGRAKRTLSIVFGTTEIAPFAKTGGLGDVSASLPRALADRGHRVMIVTLLYKHLNPEKMRFARRLKPLEVPRKGKSASVAEVVLWEMNLSDGVRIVFLDFDEYFGRDGLYGYDDKGFEDNAARFAFFSRALVEFVRYSNMNADVLHLNDWHTALAPLYIKQYYKTEFKEVSTVLTIHNLAFQGEFDLKDADQTGLTKTAIKAATHDGKLNFLKSGIDLADKVTTVSPTYADEIKTEAGGCGLDKELSARKTDLVGILNGADTGVWNPSIDQYIEVRYDIATLNGKRRNKAQLQHDFGLPVRPVLPIVAFVGRFTEQKGIDVLITAVRKLLKDNEDERGAFQFVALGEGDKKLEKAAEKLASEFPKRVAVHIGYSEELAHRIIAGSDILALPSRFEPCGLTQIYAMRYGTLPLVHRTGGLADTVKDADVENGSGFVFDDFSRNEIIKTIERAVDRYHHHRQWRPLMVTAMEQDFSWSRSARAYDETYLGALGFAE